jgi:ABC-type transporter Mla MlaB component
MNTQVMAVSQGMKVVGVVHFGNVMSIAEQGNEIIQNIGLTSTHFFLDLQDMQPQDSSALAILVEWQKKAQAQHYTLLFLHIPTGILNLIRVSGLSTWISEYKTHE